MGLPWESSSLATSRPVKQEIRKKRRKSRFLGFLPAQSRKPVERGQRETQEQGQGQEQQRQGQGQQRQGQGKQFQQGQEQQRQG